VHAVVERTGTGVGCPAVAEDPGWIGVVVGTYAHRDYWSEDLDGIDIDVGPAPCVLETHGVGAIPQVRAIPGGLPGQGGIGSGDGIQIDIINVNIDRTTVGVLGEGQGEP